MAIRCRGARYGARRVFTPSILAREYSREYLADGARKIVCSLGADLMCAKPDFALDIGNTTALFAEQIIGLGAAYVRCKHRIRMF